VVQRVDQEIQNPRLKDKLVEQVENGKPLSNPDAAKVYDLQVEKTKSIVTKVLIGPHAQYRMDLRKVSVKDVQKAFVEWAKEAHALRKRNDPFYGVLSAMIEQGQKIRYTTPSRLTIVFAVETKGVAKLVSTWWDGVPDPAPPGTCEVR